MKYNDKVRIKEWFYEWLVWTLQNRYSKLIDNNDWKSVSELYSYDVRFEKEYMTIKFTENMIEKI